MRAFLKKLSKDKGGNVLVIAGAGTLALVGGAGLGVDTVQWYLWQRQLQNAVDAGALAGANALYQGASFTDAIDREIDRNQDNTLAGLTITGRNNSPLSGSYQTDAGAVEVTATIQRTLPFSSLFITTAPTISARAVATTVTDGEHCVYSLAEEGVGIYVNGGANVLLGCGIVSNSRGNQAIDFNGSTAYLQGSPISAVGGIDYEAANVDSGTAILPYGGAQPDPLSGQFSMSDLPATSCDKNNFRVGPSDTVTLNPSTEAGTPGYMHLCGNTRVQGTLNLKSGIYILDGGTFTVNATANLKSNGYTYDPITGTVTNAGEAITLILTNGAKIDMAGGANVSLRAPNDDDTSFVDPDFNGLLIYQDPSDPQSASNITGSSKSGLNGIIYMPKTDLSITGNAGLTAECLFLVTYMVKFSGDADIASSCEGYGPEPDNSARIVRLVE